VHTGRLSRRRIVWWNRSRSHKKKKLGKGRIQRKRLLAAPRAHWRDRFLSNRPSFFQFFFPLIKTTRRRENLWGSVNEMRTVRRKNDRTTLKKRSTGTRRFFVFPNSIRRIFNCALRKCWFQLCSSARVIPFTSGLVRSVGDTLMSRLVSRAMLSIRPHRITTCSHWCQGFPGCLLTN